ncbi:hypothetical protein [Actinosynnema sp. NPDC023587]|uniref:hypothetical protein n=1 Tax=Actinosynnema sp. NPDC023587 TaxID=3154695 RepID=UPI0034113E78
MTSRPGKTRSRPVERVVRLLRPNARPQHPEPGWVMSDDGVIGAPADDHEAPEDAACRSCADG